MSRAPQTTFRYFPVSRRDQDWGCYVLTAGVAQIPPHTPYPPGGHPKGHSFHWERGRVLHEYALVYIATGRGWFECAGSRRRRVEAGDVLLLFPGVWHRYRPDPETGWTEYWVGFDGPFMRHLMQHRFFSHRRPVLRLRNEPAVATEFQSLIAVINAAPPALQQIAAGATLHLLGLLFSDQQTNPARTAKTSATIHEAIRRLHDGTGTSVNLPAQLKLSPRLLRRQFKQHTGLSPRQYQLQLRIASARRLLTETTLSIKQVAAEIGFTDEQYFCRIFKKKTGLAPSQWRHGAQPPAPAAVR